MFKISTIEHAIAILAHDVVKGAQAVNTVIQKAVALVGKQAPVIESLTGLIDPAAVPFERAAFAALGLVAKAAGDADSAAAAKGVNIVLDQQTYADFKAIYDQLSTKAKFLAAGA